MMFDHLYCPAEPTAEDLWEYPDDWEYFGDEEENLIGWDFDAHDCNVCKSDAHPTSEHKE